MRIDDSFKRQLEVEAHIQKVIEFYNFSYRYIKQLPSFHTGYQYSTNYLESISAKHGFHNSKNVLELCCGTGSSLIYLAEKYDFKIVGVDINENFIKECKIKILKNKLSKNIYVVQKNILDINEKFGKYDAIWNEDSFSHLPNKDLLFKICHELLNKDGLLVFYDLVKTTKISNKEHFQVCKSWCLWPLENKKSYLSIIKKAGFKILEVKDTMAKELIHNHREANKDLRFEYEFFPDYLLKNKEILQKKWGIENYDKTYGRSLVYNYFNTGKLDYIFFVVKKLS